VERLNRLRRHMVDDLPAPTRNDEYLIYQTLIGSWPVALADGVTPTDALASYVERVGVFIVKALREAKDRSSWVQPNEPYEAAVVDFVRRFSTPSGQACFWRTLYRFNNASRPWAWSTAWLSPCSS